MTDQEKAAQLFDAGCELWDELHSLRGSYSPAMKKWKATSLLSMENDYEWFGPLRAPTDDETQ